MIQRGPDSLLEKEKGLQQRQIVVLLVFTVFIKEEDEEKKKKVSLHGLSAISNMGDKMCVHVRVCVLGHDWAERKSENDRERKTCLF